MAVMSVRMDDSLKEEVEAFWRGLGEGPSTGLRRTVEEWWAMEHFPSIYFRNGVSGRRAVVRGGPDVWEVVSAAEDYGEDREGLYAHFEFTPREAIDEALEYAGRFPDRVREMIEQNRRVERAVAGYW